MNRKVILIILIITLIGCAVPREEDVTAINPIPLEIQVPVLLNGEAIYLSAPDGWNSFEIGESVYLMVQNLSEQPIASKYDLGVKIYLLQNNEWVGIENNVDYPDENTTLESNIPFDPLKIFTLFLLPEIPKSSGPVKLRVFVFGEKQSEDQQFATYIDLELHP